MNAWTARPSKVITQKQVISATRFVLVTRTVYTDTLLIDRMHERGQLWGRIYEAACRLMHMRRTAGMDACVTGRLDTVREGDPDDDTTDSDDRPPEEIRADYDRLMVMIGQDAAAIITSMLLGQPPGWRLPTAQDGLTVLADHWGMER